MRAVILAAGQGTRLAPYTDDRPKCLVELAGETMLARQLAVLAAAGIEDIVLVGGYRADQLTNLSTNLVVNRDFASTNMVHSLFCAEAALDGGDDILIAYSDIVYEQRVLAALLADTNGVCVAVNTDWQALWRVRMDDPLDDAESLRMAPDGRLLEIGQKVSDYARIEGQYMGLIKVQADRAPMLRGVYDDMSAMPRYAGAAHGNMYMTDFLQRLCDLDWPIHGVAIAGGWLEVDSVEDLAVYHDLADRGELGSLCKLS
ncbi:MAG: phosphocholine cytidylyltransferase family protein [Rhodospirillaceae bacterium]|jgi:L-glutamine-phosphate cytidylyltransferase|nr:phosphocholine cytidylyltransferase family protein [Rhodospirillaceae bacterium]MBT5896805.1 phosphocholine cytidylyltransferase family protein [Rhodospirillaceae bacterium]MBT6430930.1 phosphocholine cytidylyltransferase family protein [Rhodospirillaceae bacterium]